MLPEIAESFSHSLTGAELADQYGAQEPSGAPDPTLPLPHAPQFGDSHILLDPFDPGVLNDLGPWPSGRSRIDRRPVGLRDVSYGSWPCDEARVTYGPNSRAPIGGLLLLQFRPCWWLTESWLLSAWSSH